MFDYHLDEFEERHMNPSELESYLKNYPFLNDLIEKCKEDPDGNKINRLACIDAIKDRESWTNDDEIKLPPPFRISRTGRGPKLPEFGIGGEFPERSASREELEPCLSYRSYPALEWLFKDPDRKTITREDYIGIGSAGMSGEDHWISEHEVELPHPLQDWYTLALEMDEWREELENEEESMPRRPTDDREKPMVQESKPIKAPLNSSLPTSKGKTTPTSGIVVSPHTDDELRKRGIRVISHSTTGYILPMGGRSKS
jgi:hypothetical protein